MLKILGAGLPRTGTRTLCEALTILGYNTIHDDWKRLPMFPYVSHDSPFQVTAYNDVDAAADCPAALYWEEVSAAYECKVILTVRDADTWWESIKWHAEQIRQSENIQHSLFTDLLHSLLFGVAQPHEYWWKRRFAEHNLLVQVAMAVDQRMKGGNRLLVMDISAGDKWDKLCPFLGVEEPGVEWPWKNKRREN